MSDTITPIRSLNGVELHYVLQRPDVRAAFDDMMRLKAQVPFVGPDSAAKHDALAVAAADWFRLSRAAADELPPEHRR